MLQWYLARWPQLLPYLQKTPRTHVWHTIKNLWLANLSAYLLLSNDIMQLQFPWFVTPSHIMGQALFAWWQDAGHGEAPPPIGHHAVQDGDTQGNTGTIGPISYISIVLNIYIMSGGIARILY